MLLLELAAFIKAREAARLGKGKDPIIAKYRFCNVIREDDRVTRFIFQWADRWRGNKDLWFAFAVARLFNLPGTLGDIEKAVLPFKPDAMKIAARIRREAGHNVFNAAYIVSTNGIAMDKIDYVVDRVLTPLWAGRGEYRPKPGRSLNDFHQQLIKAQGMGSFMAGQVVADLKYFPPFCRDGVPDLQQAADWWTFAASGPGSRRGLNRVMGRPKDQRWMEAEWRCALTSLRRDLLPRVPKAVAARLSAQDVQNCLCELDKYERARLGEGEPKQLYKPFVG